MDGFLDEMVKCSVLKSSAGGNLNKVIINSRAVLNCYGHSAPCPVRCGHSITLCLPNLLAII